jgi:hypothetical protein
VSRSRAFTDQPSALRALSGERTWWAHFEFTRINIAPTILPTKIEDLREAGATTCERIAAWIADLDVPQDDSHAHH